MQTMQGSTLQSLVAVQTFLDANADSLGTVVTSGARKKLDDLVLQLSGDAAVQTGSAFAAQGATQKPSCFDRRSCAITWRLSRESPPPSFRQRLKSSR